MRLAIYRGTGPISVLTATGGINLAEGATVDLDQVIGPHGYTVAAALGPLEALCGLVEDASASAPMMIDEDEG